MSDFLDEFKTDTDSFKDFGSSSNENKSGGNNYGGGNSNRDRGLAEWQRRQKEVQPLYLPMIVYTEYDFPDEIKKKLKDFAIMLMNRGFTVRFNGEDFALYDELTKIGGKRAEGHLPFSPFKDMKSGEERKNKWSRNNATTDDLAKRNFGTGWDKIKKFFQILMSRNARMLIGHKMDSPAMALITWSPDGATHANQVNNETGRVGTYITMAAMAAVPVFNLQNEESLKLLNEMFLKGVDNNE